MHVCALWAASYFKSLNTNLPSCPPAFLPTPASVLLGRGALAAAARAALLEGLKHQMAEAGVLLKPVPPSFPSSLAKESPLGLTA